MNTTSSAASAGAFSSLPLQPPMLDNLQQLSTNGRRELFEGQGQVSIASAAGLLAGNSRDASMLGKPVEPAVAAGQLRVAHPFTPIPDAAAWHR